MFTGILKDVFQKINKGLRDSEIQLNLFYMNKIWYFMKSLDGETHEGISYISI